MVWILPLSSHRCPKSWVAPTHSPHSVTCLLELSVQTNLESGSFSFTAALIVSPKSGDCSLSLHSHAMALYFVASWVPLVGLANG